MVASYQISERVNAQVILWAIGSAVVTMFRLLLTVATWLPALLAVGRVVTLGAVLGAGLIGTFAVVAMIPVTFWLCLAGVIAGAFVTYPRGK